MKKNGKIFIMNFVIGRKLFIFIYFISINNFRLIFSFINKTEHEIKVTGGYRSNSDWFKYVASIRRLDNDFLRYGRGHVCGGTIITVYTILTAAHCFHDLFRRDEIRVVVGARYRLRPIKGVQIFSVSEILLHEEFNPETGVNDIALLHLSSDIEIDNTNTAIMPLPIKSPYTNMKCTAAGWGKVYYKGPQPDEIVYVDLKMITGHCNPVVHSPIGQICAHNFNDIARDTCQGDSGGPSFCSRAIYGITSLGQPCGLENNSGVYTNVYAYLDWIDLHVNGGKTIWIWRRLFYINLSIFNLIKISILLS